MAIVALPARVGKCRVQMKVEIERWGTRGGDLQDLSRVHPYQVPISRGAPERCEDFDGSSSDYYLKMLARVMWPLRQGGQVSASSPADADSQADGLPSVPR